MSCNKNKCYNSCKTYKKKSKKCPKEVDAYLSATLGEDLYIQVPFDPVEGLLKYNQINVKKNMDTQDFVDPDRTGFVIHYDGAYRISYSIHCVCSGMRVEASIVKNGEIDPVPGSYTHKLFPESGDNSENNVDKSFVTELKRGDVLSLRYRLISFNPTDTNVLFGEQTNISFNKI